MGIANFVSRPIGGSATIVTEYTKQPLVYILVFASSTLFVLDFMKEVGEEEEPEAESEVRQPKKLLTEKSSSSDSFESI